MSQILRLEFALTDAERSEARSLNLRKQFGGSKWGTNFALFALLVGMLVGAWFRFREIPEGNRALMLAVVVGGSVLFVIWKRKFRKTVPQTIQLEISESDFTILAADSRVALPWSAFSECLESPDLFVLSDRSKRSLIVVPKRAFPDENSQVWFRDQATSATHQATPARGELPVPAPSTSANRVALTVRPRYRDYLACTLASWRTRGICLFVGGLVVSVSLYAAANPPPNAVNSPAKVFILFIVPFFLIFTTIIVIVFSVHSWFLHVKYGGPEDVALSDESVIFSGANGSGVLPWTRFDHYKETPWHFILWRSSNWMMLPKRAFSSWDELNRCRDLLDHRLKHSRWFVG